MKTLRFKRKYFKMVQRGQKSLECRVNYPAVRKINVGDNVRYFWEDQTYDVKIIGVRRYEDFREMLKSEDVERLVPGMNFNQALKEYLCIYPDWKVKKYGGVVVFEAVPA